MTKTESALKSLARAMQALRSQARSCSLTTEEVSESVAEITKEERYIASILKNHAENIEALKACVDSMKRLHPAGLPITQGGLSEENDWNHALTISDNVLKKTASL